VIVPLTLLLLPLPPLLLLLLPLLLLSVGLPFSPWAAADWSWGEGGREGGRGDE